LIPLRDSIRPEKTPYINWILIALNILVFFREITLPPQLLNEVFFNLGLIPAYAVHLIAGGAFLDPYMITFLSSAFLHGGWLHVLSNMWFLFIFGDNVEDRLGHFRYLIFYLVVAIIGGLSHILSNPASQVPIIGASGAVAGILGAYFVTYPRARVLTLLPIIIVFTIVRIPAVIFLALWFVLQIFNGSLSLGGSADSVAWWAHVGGFIGGAVLIKIMAPKKRRVNEQYFR